MDISLIIFIVVIAIAAFRGYKSGIFVIVSRIVSIAFAYLAAILLTENFAHWLQQISPIKGLFAYAVAGIILFTITSVLLSFIFSWLSKKVTIETGQRSKTSAVAGGIFGGVVGGFVGVLAIWFVATFQGILQVKRGQEISYSSFQKTSQEIIKGAIEGVAEVVSDHSDIASGTAELLSNPAENIQHFNRLSQQGVLRNLLQDGVVRTALDSQNSDALFNSTAFQQLVNNDDFIALTKSLDLSEVKNEREKQLALKITNTWAQINQVQNNQEYLEIIQDPEIKQSLQSGDVLKLLNNEKIERLLQIISSSNIPEIPYQTGSGDNVEQVTNQKKKIYRWVDKNGKIHYSDKKNNRDK